MCFMCPSGVCETFGLAPVTLIMYVWICSEMVHSAGISVSEYSLMEFLPGQFLVRLGLPGNHGDIPS